MGEVLYKEVTPYPGTTERWKDITINAGASQSTLQDIKLPETAGCFTYKDSGNLSSSTSNRFILWRTSNDVLELVEVSLNANLKGNHVRLRFQHTPVLQGVSIHETQDQIIILIATVSTIHRIPLPHPTKLQGKGYFLQQSNIILPSIFFDVSLANLRDQSSYFVLNHATAGIPLPHTSSSWLTPQGDAAFILANSVGSLLLVVMSESGVKVMPTELKKTSMMSRLWNGIVSSATRVNQGGDVALSIVCHEEGSDVLIYALCRDLRIRMWSQNKQECVMASSVLEHCGDGGNGNLWNFTAQQCCLRKSLDKVDSCYYLGVFISFPEQNQFCIFQPICIRDQYRLSHLATLNGPKYDLVDFCLSTSHVWTLWLNSQSEPVIKIAAFESEEQVSTQPVWVSVDTQHPVSRDVYVTFGELDPREAYLNEIFRQGRFSPSTISKAINIYRRLGDTSFSVDFAVEMEGLKDEAIKAVESEIMVKGGESDLNDEEYQDLQVECWDRFFSYCIQYHEVGTKPLGLSLDPETGCIIVVKKNVYSLLRPCDSFEQLILPISYLDSSSTISNIDILADIKDPALCSSVMSVLQYMGRLSKNLNEEMFVAFEHDLFHLRKPIEIALEFTKELSLLPWDGDCNLMTKLQQEVQKAPSLVPALQQLLKWLDLGQKSDSSIITDSVGPQYANYRNFLCSSSGISVVCEGVSQFVRDRYSFCRNLLILELLLSQLLEKSNVHQEKSEKILSEIVPHTSKLVCAYYTMMWCTECVCMPLQPAILEAGLQQLSLLDVSESMSASKVPKGYTLGNTIVHFFLSEQGGNQARHLMGLQCTNDESIINNWTYLLPILISNAAQILWPLGPHFLFPEFLFTKCQYLPLQGYVRLLSHWCEWNNCSRKFLSASSLLTLGEHEKAQDLFCQVAGGVEKEEFLCSKIMQGVENTASLIAQYYMKVIQLFEYFGHSDCVISLASTAIGTIDTNDPHIPIFWSLVFKHHLELGHSEHAYTAMTRNPDPARQKDCLRQLIVILCERKQFHTLIEFPYSGMSDDVISILESRARSCDLLRQNYYDLLYAFHIHTSNFRKAATITFEYGMRLSQEVSSLPGLEKQAACYLSTINSLHLVDSRFAWIVKPVPKSVTLDNDDGSGVSQSPKRNSDGDEIQSTTSTRIVEVLQLSDIRREYQLIHARLLLVQEDPSPTNIAMTPLSPTDTIALLINAGLFDTARELCKAYKLSLIPIFEGLAYRCVNLSKQCKSHYAKEDEFKALDWLNKNDITNLPTSSYVSNHEQVWYLLKNYLEQYEMPGQTKFHRCVACKLLTVGVQLPAWLKHSYQSRNCAELLWLYISFGMLENATDLAVDYIDAVLGYGKQDFGIKFALHANSPPVWLPHTYLDALLEALEEVRMEYNCASLYRRLKEKLKVYNHNVESISKIMELMPRQRTLVSS